MRSEPLRLARCAASGWRRPRESFNRKEHKDRKAGASNVSVFSELSVAKSFGEPDKKQEIVGGHAELA